MDLPFFPWNLLPLEIQHSILSLLPISSLIRCCTVSKSFRFLIQSQTFTPSPSSSDIHFLLFSDPHNKSVSHSYNPSLNRWIPLHFPPNTIATVSSHSSFLIALLPITPYRIGGPVTRKKRFIIFNPFTGSSTNPMKYTVSIPYAFISKSQSEFNIIGVSVTDRLCSYTYNSRNCRWIEKGILDAQFHVIGNPVFLNGLLFCLSSGPDHLLTFDPVTGEWSLLDVVVVPSVVCSHLLVFDGGLFLVGGVEEVGVIVKVGIWELDCERMEWRDVCFMPDGVFARFSEPGMNRFEVVDRKGKICFRNTSASVILMCDLKGKRWWWPPPLPRALSGVVELNEYWIGLAVEPCIDLVKQLVGRDAIIHFTQ